MIYTVQYRVEVLEAQTPREAAQMVANGLATGQHFPMTFNVFGPGEAYVSTETVTRIEEVALLEVPVAAPTAADEEPWPDNSVMAALEELLAGDRGLNRERVRAYLIENEDWLWKTHLGPMADKIEAEIVDVISVDERYNAEHPDEELV